MKPKNRVAHSVIIRETDLNYKDIYYRTESRTAESDKSLAP